MPEARAPQPDAKMIEGLLQNVRGTIPLSIEQIETILRLVAASQATVKSYLDLGCAGGVLAPALLDEYPGARANIVQFTGSLVEAARMQLGPRLDRVAIHLARIQTPSWLELVRDLAPYDLITSGVEIPLLPQPRQQAFFREVYDLLRPGGFFLAIQHVASATRWTQSPWDDQMIEAIFGETLKKDRHRPRTEVAWEFYQNLARESQKIAPLEVQCDWLREIGFESVECFLKVSEMAVFGGIKPGPERADAAGGAREFVTGG
jgi:SAM-dependent methyltransferase